MVQWFIRIWNRKLKWKFVRFSYEEKIFSQFFPFVFKPSQQHSNLNGQFLHQFLEKCPRQKDFHLDWQKSVNYAIEKLSKHFKAKENLNNRLFCDELLKRKLNLNNFSIIVIRFDNFYAEKSYYFCVYFIKYSVLFSAFFVSIKH